MSGDRATAVWVAMADMFGELWASSNGDTPADNPTWAAGIGRLTDQQVQHGLIQIESSGSEFPPSWPRFKAMCMAFYDPQQNAIEHEDRPAGGRFKEWGNIKLLDICFKACSQGGPVPQIETDGPVLRAMNKLAIDMELLQQSGEDWGVLATNFEKYFDRDIRPLV